MRRDGTDPHREQRAGGRYEQARGEREREMHGDRGSSEREADAHEHRQRHRDEAGVNGYLARERQETDYTRNADVGGARESGKDRYGDEVGGSVGATRKMTLVAEKETTRTTDAETTETKHGTMGVKRKREILFCAQCQGRRATHTRMDTDITS